MHRSNENKCCRFKITRWDSSPALILPRDGSFDLRTVILSNVLPAFLLMRQACLGDASECTGLHHLAIVDEEGGQGRHSQLYQMLFEKEVLWLNKARQQGAALDPKRVVCFSKARIYANGACKLAPGKISHR